MRLPVLPVLAAGCVLLLGLALVATWPTGAVGRPGLRVVDGAGGSFAVGERWSATPAGAVLFYADERGRAVAGLAGAQVADVGWCAGWPASQRGFAGLAPLEPGAGARAVGALVRRVAARWARGITARPPPDVDLARVRLADGVPALRASLRLVPAAGGGPCAARRVRLDVVGYAGAEGLSTFVLVRDLGPGGIGTTEAEAVLQSLRSRT